MELYAQYLKERDDVECIYTDDCFMTYKIDEDSVLIIDIYSRPEVRGTGKMKEMVDSFIAELPEEVEYVLGMTYTNTNGWENSERLLLKYGFKFTGIDPEDENKRNYGMILNRRD